MVTDYPIAGTSADRILKLIEEQPGISVSAIKRILDTKPTPTRHCLKALLAYGLIEDRPDERKYHHYYRKVA